jgi:ABC-type glycerol-3-phosphate transport system substrate-binding protein
MKRMGLVLLALATAVPLFAGGRSQSSSTVSGARPVIEVFMSPHVNQPKSPDWDPFKDYMDQLTNADWRISVSTDFESAISTRVVANDIPDLILFDSAPILFNMYDQGILLDDWNIYKDRMPTAWNNMGEVQRNYFTVDGKLILVAVMPGDQAWAWNIRKDWLSKLGLKTPTTPEELLEVAKAFTFNDPDGNGQNDTYGFTSAGNNKNIGEIGNLLLMYGPTTFYIKDNGVTHPVLDGNYKKFLDFMRQIVDAKVIDPDWYNMEWESRKPSMANGKYGIVWYPPAALLGEIDGNRQNDLAVLNWYTYFATPRGSLEGGKLSPSTIFGYSKRTASARAGRDRAKMDAIVTLLETTAVGNQGYWDVSTCWNYVQGTLKKVNGIDYIYFTPEQWQENQNHQVPPGNQNWWKIFSTVQNKYVRLSGNTPEPGELTLESQLQTSQVEAAARYDTGYSQLLVLDQANSSSVGSVTDEFSIQYILNQTNDYEGYRRRWLSSGGQALLDQATEQFKKYGYIK